MNAMFSVSLTIPGTLAANHVFDIKAPCNCQLIHVSLSNSTANAGTLKIGTSSDDDAHLAAEDFGVSNTPVVVDSFSEFDGAGAGGQYPKIALNEQVKVTVTDHGSHMANVIVVLTFTEG